MRSSRIGITTNGRSFKKMKKMEIRETELFYCIALTQIKGLGPVSIRQLVGRVGSARALFEMVENPGDDSLSLGAFPIECIRKQRDSAFRVSENEMRLIEKHNVRTLIMGDEEYPYRLMQCPDAPLVLYAYGGCSLNLPRMLALVGSRRATGYGLGQTEKMVSSLAEIAPCVVSGMAYGIDTRAHASALACNLPTVAVLGNGLGTIYPYSNKKLFEQIRENGLILTEFLFESASDAFHFPLRNRIIAGISDAVVVMEAKRRSGALITADLAFSYSREVFACPGRMTDEMSEGCNLLVAQNKALLLTSPRDVVEHMGWDGGANLPLFSNAAPLPEMDEDEQKLYGFLQTLSTPDIDTLYENSGLSLPDLKSLLLSMECKGLIKSLSGNRFCCI